MPADPDSDRSVYRQVADTLREKIATGELAPGEKLPPEKTIAQIEDVSRDSARKALAILRSEGLIRTSRRGSFVREPGRLETVRTQRGDEIRSRMPTEAERRSEGIDQGVPYLVLTRQGTEELLRADEYRIVDGRT